MIMDEYRRLLGLAQAAAKAAQQLAAKSGGREMSTAERAAYQAKFDEAVRLKDQADQARAKSDRESQVLLAELSADDGDAPLDDDDGTWSLPGSKSRPVTQDPIAAKFVQHLRNRGGVSAGQKALLAPSGSVSLPVDIGAVLMPQNPYQVRSLVTNGQLAEGDNYSFLRQTLRTNNAAVVAVGALKPTSLYTLTRIAGTVATVAHLTEGVPRQWLDDVADLQLFLARELTDGVLRKVDDIIVSGNGTTEPAGILTTSGVLTQAFVTDALTSLRTALTTLQSAGENPSAIVMRPSDWQTVEQQRDLQGRYQLGGVPQDAPALRLFGLPVVLSLAVAAGTAIVGDFSTVALLTRQGVRVDWSEAGAELFDRNLVKFRGEARIGVAVGRPSAFSVVDLTA